MKEFFDVKTIEQALEYTAHFVRMGTEHIPLTESAGRILAEDIRSDTDLPEFARSIMDGYAVNGASTFGAGEGNPAYLEIVGTVAMGQLPDFSVGPGQAVRISTGGLLPQGADSVVMIEHTAAIDDNTIEVYRSVAPGQNMVAAGEDLKKGEQLLADGCKIRPPESGLLAALGKTRVKVYKVPRIGIISTGDEIVAVDARPGPGQIRDINTYTLAGLVGQTGAAAIPLGIVKDDYESLRAKCAEALEQYDMVIVSGGSSVGARDYTIDIIAALQDAQILFHGISISPGKPTILARVGQKAFWGLPGHVVSAMIVFSQIVTPFIEYISGFAGRNSGRFQLTARLSRNVASAQGRVDFVRVRLERRGDTLWAEPVLGKSGLISTMVKADGLIAIGIGTEGLEKGAAVQVIPL